MDGRHVATMLVAEGHLAGAEQYTEELARDILTAGSDEAKKRAYRELEEAIKESQKHTAEETKAAKTKAEADLPPEGIGLGGWVGIFMLVGILTWAVFLAPAKKKKVNLNRKRGLFEKMWLKLKGA
ncbi:unnamed protein product [Prorocentrum cordatum]|uniref:TPM domain-containing protein n=1 Tax=Prorocentrum cordatum TaxID=2364126 RepID=A0ABN9UB05_9DINO|nr:unnamed protein product [Polarella glacialis]